MVRRALPSRVMTRRLMRQPAVILLLVFVTFCAGRSVDRDEGRRASREQRVRIRVSQLSCFLTFATLMFVSVSNRALQRHDPVPNRSGLRLRRRCRPACAAWGMVFGRSVTCVRVCFPCCSRFITVDCTTHASRVKTSVACPPNFCSSHPSNCVSNRLLACSLMSRLPPAAHS
jgi:hypothetical protein